MAAVVAMAVLAAALAAFLVLRGGGAAPEGERALVRLAAESGRSVLRLRGQEGGQDRNEVLVLDLLVDGLAQSPERALAGAKARSVLVLSPGRHPISGRCRFAAPGGLFDTARFELDAELAPGRIYELGLSGAPAPDAMAPGPSPGRGDLRPALKEIGPP